MKKLTVKRFKQSFRLHWQLYLMLIPSLVWLFVFRYKPMHGLQIAFKDYNIRAGFSGSPWVGLQHFASFVTSYYFPRLIWNTVGISLFSLIAGCLPPIILAIALNECNRKFFKKSVQMLTYVPYFLSTVVVVSMMTQIFSLNGLVNALNCALGGRPISFFGEASMFKSLYVGSEIWQKTGYGSVIYVAALAGISPELQEAAEIDGANIWQRIWHVDIPGILPTAIILFIVNSANLLNVGFEKVFLMQNPLNMSASDVISTYTYRMGLVDMNYSLATAVGLFQSVISLLFMMLVNRISGRISEVSLW